MVIYWNCMWEKWMLKTLNRLPYFPLLKSELEHNATKTLV